MHQLTPEAHQKLLQKKKELEEKRVVIVERIERAKELGDLSENIEYITARQDFNFTLSELEKLEETLRDSEIVEILPQKNCVALGSTVEIEYNNKIQKFKIVSFNEANPTEGKISNESPIGHSLMNRCVGDLVEIQIPNGILKCKLKKIY